MRLIKWMLVAVLMLGGVFLVGSFLLPATTVVERSRELRHTPAETFVLLDSFERFTAWSPWVEFDPQAAYVRSGPAAGVGARLAWSGNSALGTGSQEIIASDPAAGTVDVALDFGGYPARTRYSIAPAAAGSHLTWRLEMAHGYDPFARWIGLLMERMVGPDLERGLERIDRLPADG